MEYFLILFGIVILPLILLGLFAVYKARQIKQRERQEKQRQWEEFSKAFFP